VQDPEFPGGESEGDTAAVAGAVVNRSYSVVAGNGPAVVSGKKAKANPEVATSFDGLNFRDQRTANNGNQFSVEPPDQSLCVGNGYVVEAVNDVLRVFDSAGAPVSGVVDLNTFYGYPAAIDRTTLLRGPFVTDPICHFDVDTQRFYQAVLTLDVDPVSGAFTGPNHIDIAVSNTSNPTGSWTIYRLPVQDDGTQGTPNHHCSLGPCIGDYPHIGADKHGIYITTNEYSLNGPEFKAAQIYAFSKTALASGAANVAVTQLDTTGLDAGNPGFTVWPAESPGNQYANGQGGTEYFLSSNAAEEANGDGSSTSLLVWALSNTKSLNSANPALSLSNTALTVGLYAVPPKANQKAGDFPLGQCINDTTMITPFGPGCWQFLFLAEPAHNEVISHLDANDTRMQQVYYANGKLWGALDTAVTIPGDGARAGIAWYIVDPSVSAHGLSASLDKQGYVAIAGNNVTYPALAVNTSGRGAIAFTLVGNDYYPSAAYASLDAKAGVGDIHLAAAGLGPSDGFTSYKAYVGDPPRTRWGDYGAAVVVGDHIWIASEYIAQTCTLAQYVAAPFGSCGGTRAALGNWATRITDLNMHP
jgi:hypothetical protein